MEWTRDNFTVTTDKAKFDMEFVVLSLQSLWRKGVRREKIEMAFGNSLSFGVFDREKQIGFVRAVTDRIFVSWVCDLFVDTKYRGRGLGEWLMHCVKEHPDLAHTRLVFSATPEACKFYEHIGFLPMERGYSMYPRSTGPSIPPYSKPNAL